jgi:hypothetical protein
VSGTFRFSQNPEPTEIGPFDRLTGVVILGWIAEAAVKWTVASVLSHFQ